MKTVISFSENNFLSKIALIPTYIDFRTLGLLFALMLVVQGLKSCGMFDVLTHHLLKHIKTGRQLAFMLVFLCFFTGMLVTNDVALITFIPFSLMILSYVNDDAFTIRLIVLQTVAANLGSMFTPVGNPQNLYLYSISGMSLMEFLKLMLPYTVLSFLLLLGCILLIKPFRLPDSSDKLSRCSLNLSYLILYIILFGVCILTVLSLLDYRIMLIIVFCVTLLFSPKLIPKVDYTLLLTFVVLFIFIGYIKDIPDVSLMLKNIISDRECPVAIAVSQIVSNVPAAMLLSGFTTNYSALIIGTNLGGLGTLIASMASLISFKFYAGTETCHKGKYILAFTIVNLIFLAALSLLYFFIG